VESLYLAVAVFLLFTVLRYVARRVGQTPTSRPPEDEGMPFMLPQRSAGPPAASPTSESPPAATGSEHPIRHDRTWDLRRAVRMMAVLGPCRGLVGEDRRVSPPSDAPPHGP
jgi:hypothetical protein